MTQYNSIEDAILALTQKFGIDIFENTPRFIAILSDYAPNHTSEQANVRAFARANGMARIVTCIKRKDSYSTLMAAVCECAVQSTDDMEQRGVMVRTAKAIAAAFDKRYEKCADPSSVYAEGMNYFRKFPKDKNIPVAILLLEEAWNLGCDDALLYLASAFLKGKGIQKNIEKGMHYLELATEAGNIRAGLDYAEHLWKGIDVDKDPPRAVAILKQLEDSNAFFMLGEIFRENAEYEKAFNYYLEGAKSNHVYAQFSVALAFATGQGIKRDMQEAKRWLKSAASLGHGEAQHKLKELGEKWD